MHLKDIIHIPVKALSVIVDQQGLSDTLRDLAIVARANGDTEKAEQIEALADAL
jgi:hypothetical protein